MPELPDPPRLLDQKWERNAAGIIVPRFTEKHPAPPAEAPAIPAPPAEVPSTRVKRLVGYAQIAGPVIAVGGILLAGWGYWKTVLPVLQYQQLKEQSVMLEMKNNALSKQSTRLADENAEAVRTLDATRQRLAEEAKRGETLQDSLAKAEAERSWSLHMAAEARLREASANALAAKSEADLRAKQAILEKATWTVLFNALDESLLSRTLSSAFLRDNKSDDPGQFILDYPSGSDPHSVLLELVGNLPQSPHAPALVPSNFYSQLAAMIDERRAELHCDAPSPGALHAAFLADYEDAKRAANTKVDEYIAREVQVIEAQGNRATGIAEAKAKMLGQYESSEGYQVKQKYLSRMFQEDSKCSAIQRAVINELKKLKGVQMAD